MSVAIASRSARRSPARRRSLAAALVAAGLALTACGGDEPAEDADTSPSTPTTSGSASTSPSPTGRPTPSAPSEPKFADTRAGKRAFVEYIVDGWGYGLSTNDPSVLIDASGRKPCRGCDTYRNELKQRKQEGWYVEFPGADVRKVTFRPDGGVEVATAVVDIPSSQSLFTDGTVRNENKAHRGARFLVDIRADGKRKKRHWTLVAFSIK